jgi:hypothetical protein
MPRPQSIVVAVLAGVLASVVLNACGGAAANQSAGASNNEQNFAQFAKCMREHGIEAKVQTGSQGGELRITGHAGKGTPQQMEAAQKACSRFQPKGGKGPNLTPAERAQRADQVLAFARCMRAHGINVPNPETSGGGIGIRIQGGINPNDPKFQQAQQACQKLLPQLKRTGAGNVTSSGPGPGGASLDQAGG